MNSAIVITSISKPTEAVKLFAGYGEHSLIVVGDKKTPKEWGHAGVRYVSVEEQCAMGFSLAEKLPYNHYCRKMLGYLLAIREGANWIVDTDDDNVPKDDWSFPEFRGNFATTAENLGFINIYQLFTKQKIWPRGLPLRHIKTSCLDNVQLADGPVEIGMWQGLADLDPDVDAIYRLTSNEPCTFDDRPPVVLGVGTIAPLNTQNTAVRKELFALLYLPVFVTFRFTDILRGLVAQPILWAAGYRVGFTKATVIQYRNEHDYFTDFRSEIPMYEHCEDVVKIATSVVSPDRTISSNLLSVYAALRERGVVTERELECLRLWLDDVAQLSG